MTSAENPAMATPVGGLQVAEELASQPEVWARATGLVDERSALPAAGSRVAVVGCGTSWFMAQCYAALRESGGNGVTDAFTASEAFLDRDYDAVVAITRSGTTTEVLELLAGIRAGVRGRPHTIGIVGDPNTPLAGLVDDLIAFPFADEQSVVQTRFATTALAALRASLGFVARPQSAGIESTTLTTRELWPRQRHLRRPRVI